MIYLAPIVVLIWLMLLLTGYLLSRASDHCSRDLLRKAMCMQFAREQVAWKAILLLEVLGFGALLLLGSDVIFCTMVATRAIMIAVRMPVAFLWGRENSPQSEVGNPDTDPVLRWYGATWYADASSLVPGRASR